MPFSRLQTVEGRVTGKFHATIVHRYCISQAQQSCHKLPQDATGCRKACCQNIRSVRFTFCVKEMDQAAASVTVFRSVIEVLDIMESNLKDM